MTPLPSLDDLMTAEPNGSWNVPDGWQQGRGAFGGIVVGAMLRSIQAAEPDPSRTVRSVTAELVGPVLPGAARIQVQLLRRSNSVSTLRAWITQSGSDEILAHAVAVLGQDRAETPEWSAAAPTVPALVDAIDMPVGIAPVFSKHFEYRPTGPYPFTAHPVAEAAGFVRVRGPASRLDAAFLAAHADAYWPAAMAAFDLPRPAATVAFSLHLQGSLAGSKHAGSPLYHRAISQSCQGGYASETRELYTFGGELLAVNHQLIAIIK